MIDILTIIIILLALILFKIFMLPVEISIIIEGLIISGFCYYIALNTSNVFISKMFMTLTFVSIIMIIGLEIYEYVKKLR